MLMELGRGLNIERDGDTLTIRAKNSITRWLGGLFAGAGLGLVITAANPHTDRLSHIWIVLLCGVFSAGCGVYLIVPHVYTTIFNSRSRQVVYSTSICNRAPKMEHYSFEEITGIGLNKSIGISHCSPYLQLKERGRRLLLSPHNGFVSVSAGVTLLEAICAATGLPVLDLDSWWS
jgi:hypothetical protein